MNPYFATCPRGLEALLADELTALGADSVRSVAGGVHFAGDWAVCYRANLESRLATRILWRLGRAPYVSEEEVYELARAQRWNDYFGLAQTFRVFTTATRSPLKSLDFVTLRVKDAICDRFRARTGERPDVESRNPDIRVHVFLTEGECTLYIDTSGQPLWQRGLRHATVDAPLKENLAAGILRLTGWQPGTPLIDPMCGSGTFALEAVQMALDQAPGLGREFGFERLASFEAETWRTVREAALARCRSPEPLGIVATDIDPRAIRATQRNLADAGFAACVTVDRADLRDFQPSGPAGILLANPPYGERLGEADELAALYPQLGTALKRHWAGWSCFFITADLRLPKLLGLKPSRKTPLFNGPLECRLFEIRMVAGSNRKER